MTRAPKSASLISQEVASSKSEEQFERAERAVAVRADEESAQKRGAKARRAYFYVWTIVGVILLTGVLIFLLHVLSLPVSIILWTVVIVFCLRGIVSGLEKHGVNRGIGTTIAYVVMVLIIGFIGFLLFSPMFGLSSQFTSLVQSIPTYVNEVSKWASQIYNSNIEFFDSEAIRSFLNDIQNNLSNWVTDLATQSASGVVEAGTTVANVFVAIGFALVIAFWILLELPAIGRECTRLIGPRHAEDAQFIHVTLTRVMGGYIKATVLQCLIIGVACGILFAVVRIPSPAALGGITGILNIIPIIGPWLGGIAAALVGIFTSPLAAIIAVVGTIIIQQFVYTFISPKLMADSVDVHPALTLLALMAGSAIGGAMSGLPGSLVGMLASIPAVAVAKSLFVYYFEKRTSRRIVSEDGVFFKGTPATGTEVDPMVDATSPHPDSTAALEKINTQNRRVPWKVRSKRNASPRHHVHNDHKDDDAFKR